MESKMSKKKEYIKFCAHCGNKATQEIVYTHRVMEKSFTMDGELSGSDLPSEYNVTICKTCYGLLLYLIEGDYPGDNGLNYSYLLWPEFGINENALPKTVLSCYKEALLIKERSPSSFAVQIVLTPFSSPVFKLVFKPFEGPPKTSPVKMSVIWLSSSLGQAPGEITRCHVTQRTVRSKLIIVSSPCLQLTPCILN